MSDPIAGGDHRGELLLGPGGRQIGWLARGPASGTPVFYLHGWPGSRLEQGLISGDVLERFGVRLISVDRPGYGNTDPLHGERSERVRDVLTLADALGVDRFAVMGISCGGSNVVTLAASAPERISKVLIVSGQMPYDDEDAIRDLAPDQFAELPLMRRGRTAELEASCERDRDAILENPVGWLGDLPTFSGPERRLAQERWFVDVLAADLQEGVRRGSEGLVGDAVVCVRPFDVDVSTVRCPVVAVHGTADDWEPLPNLRRVLRRIPDADLVLLQDKNHLGPFLYPDLLISLVAETGSGSRATPVRRSVP